jgi:serine/threonine protein phosphatase 1
MKNHTLNLPLDLTKRHFVVGDVHGKFDSLMRLLESADYDPETDIVYSVGDMIDRGPESFEVFEFFHQPNTYAIQGNHEHMVVEESWFGVWLNNGGLDTQISLSDNGVDQEYLGKLIKKLPYVIDVGDADEEHSFRIVHACLPLVWSEEQFQFILADAEDAEDPTFAHILWSRTDIGNAERNIATMKPITFGMNVSPDRSGRNVFAGHSPIRKPMTVGDVTYIDTWAARTLTMVEAVTQQVWSVAANNKIRTK